MDYKKVARQITRAIKEDLTDRYGLRQEWEMCDRQTQKEIIGAWNKIVEGILLNIKEKRE